jgi:hypothetical protein
LHIDYDDYRAGRNGICPIRPHRECQEPGKHRRRRRKAGWRRCGKEVPDKTVADMFFISAGLYPEQLPTCSLSPLGFIPNSCRHVLYLRWALSRTAADMFFISAGLYPEQCQFGPMFPLFLGCPAGMPTTITSIHRRSPVRVSQG